MRNTNHNKIIGLEVIGRKLMRIILMSDSFEKEVQEEEKFDHNRISLLIFIWNFLSIISRISVPISYSVLEPKNRNEI